MTTTYIDNTDTLKLIEAEIPHLKKLARSLTRNAERSDDVLQDGLVRAVANADRFESGTNIRAWLATIMRNAFYNHCRKLKRERQALAQIRLAKADPFEPARQEDVVMLNDIGEFINELPVKHQTLLKLIAIDGLSYQAAASRMQLKVGTVKSRLNRTRALLHKKLW